jgi:hypothetical protein
VAPSSPITTITARRRLCLARRGLISASRARMPPSPWLSARMMSSAYLMEMTTISDQKISDTIPSTASGATVPPELEALRVTLTV